MLAIFGALFLADLVPVAFGAQYRAVAPNLFILSLAVLMLTLSSVSNVQALVHERPGVPFQAGAIRLVVFWSAGPLLVARWDSLGACIAVVAAASARAGYLTWRMRDAGGARQLTSWLIPIGLGVLFLPMTWFRSSSAWNLAVYAVFVTGYLSTLLGLRVLTMSELASLASMTGWFLGPEVRQTLVAVTRWRRIEPYSVRYRALRTSAPMAARTAIPFRVGLVPSVSEPCSICENCDVASPEPGHPLQLSMRDKLHAFKAFGLGGVCAPWRQSPCPDVRHEMVSSRRCVHRDLPGERPRQGGNISRRLGPRWRSKCRRVHPLLGDSIRRLHQQPERWQCHRRSGLESRGRTDLLLHGPGLQRIGGGWGPIRRGLGDDVVCSHALNDLSGPDRPLPGWFSRRRHHQSARGWRCRANLQDLFAAIGLTLSGRQHTDQLYRDGCSQADGVVFLAGCSDSATTTVTVTAATPGATTGADARVSGPDGAYPRTAVRLQSRLPRRHWAAWRLSAPAARPHPGRASQWALRR